jgi:serine protease Do
MRTRLTLAVVALLLSACFSLPPPAQAHQPGAEEIFAAARPATVLVQINAHVIASYPAPIMDQAKLTALNADIDSLIVRGQIRSQAAADAYFYEQVLSHPGDYFIPGSGRESQEYAFEAVGSGFFVTSDGYLVTAAHLVAPTNEDFRQQLVDSLGQDDLTSITASVRQGYSEAGIPINDAQVRLLGQWTLDYFKQHVQVDSFTKDIYVAGGSSVRFGLSGPVDGALHAIEVTSGQGSPGKDVSILRVAGNGFPALGLGDERKLASGSSLYLLGYPCNCDLQHGTQARPDHLDVVGSQGKPTSSEAQTGWTAIGTNAKATHGDSGGPVFGSDGRVVGIVSYGSNGDSFLVPATVVREYTDRASVQPAPGATTELYRAALADYYQHRYRSALALLHQVAKLDPSHPYLTDFVVGSEAGISAGKDRTPPDLSPYVLPAVGVYLFGALGLVSVAGWVGIRRRGPARRGEPPVVA